MSPLASLCSKDLGMVTLMQTKLKSHGGAACVLHSKAVYEATRIGPLHAPLADAEGLKILLPPTTAHTTYTEIRQHIEECVLRGDTTGRGALNTLLPLVAFGLPISYVDYLQPQHIPQMAHAPDLYPYVLQAYMPAIAGEDRLATMFRSTFTFFPASKRMQKRSRWDVSSSASLVTFLRCCVPTLLSLFQEHSIKDLDFDFRVAVYRHWHGLLSSNHHERAAFFKQHRVLLMVCFSEFFLHYITTVQPLDPLVLSPGHAALLRRSYTNIAQALRTEINLYVAKHYTGTGKVVDVAAILTAFQTRGQLLLDRGIRYSKSIGCKPRCATAHRTAVVKTRWKRAEVLSMLRDQERHIGAFPFARDFALFVAYCERQHIATTHRMVLWHIVSHIYVEPSTRSMAVEQINTLAENFGISSSRMRKNMHYMTCVVCSFFGQEQKLRYDTDLDRYDCAHCELPGTVARFPLVGRILYAHGIAFALAPGSGKLVLFSPLHLHPAAREEQTHTFELDIATAIVNHKTRESCQQLSLGHVLVATSAQTEPDRIPILEDSDSGVRVDVNGKMHCSLCRSLSITESHVLLDTCGPSLVLAHLCTRHAVPPIARHIPLRTVADFWRIQNARRTSLTYSHRPACVPVGVDDASRHGRGAG